MATPIAVSLKLESLDEDLREQEMGRLKDMPPWKRQLVERKVQERLAQRHLRGISCHRFSQK